MNTLPKNLRTDLAIHVHFNTLSKVKLFQDCDKTLLFDLVLKLKPILYLPGDYVCRKVLHNIYVWISEDVNIKYCITEFFCQWATDFVKSLKYIIIPPSPKLIEKNVFNLI